MFLCKTFSNFQINFFKREREKFKQKTIFYSSQNDEDNLNADSNLDFFAERRHHSKIRNSKTDLASLKCSASTSPQQRSALRQSDALAKTKTTDRSKVLNTFIQ